MRAVPLRLALLVGLTTLTSCARDQAGDAARDAARDTPVRRAFYVWRTTVELSARERDALGALGVSRLFVRAFDVAPSRDGTPQLTAPVTFSGPWPAGVELVPVVFVREAVLHTPPSDALVTLVAREVRDVVRRAGVAKISELQLDCDWTDGSRANYFALVEALAAVMRADGVELSATIRLHQIKYRERTGIPPVTRGTLMFYNMGTLGGPAPAEGTSIFDPVAASRYLERISEYPLPLDVALPIWSWTLHLRDGRVEGLLQSTDPSELTGLGWLRARSATELEATETTFFRGHLVRAGDVLRAELTAPEAALTAASMITPRLAAHARTVTLFDLSERTLTRHDVPSLERLFRATR
ncbi:hypothetical protein L6R52_10950 [Myxococcota bacterium]|nr:hypothetical protein [Myxococcota bacterium]